MKGYIKIAVVAMCCITWACGGNKVLDREAYLEWINDPGSPLLNKKVIGGYSFEAQYRPSDLVTLQEFREAGNHISSATFDSLKKEFDGMQYFTLKIGTDDPSRDMLSYGIVTEQEYYDRIRYFSSEAQQDIFLVDDGDTLGCALYHFERTYGASPFNSIILGFEKRTDPIQHAKQLHMNDRVLGNGMLIFTFQANAVNAIPQLKL